MSKIKPTHTVIAFVVILFAVILVTLSLTEQPGEQSVDGNVITQTIGVIDTNATAEFDIRLLEGSDAEHESAHLFGTFAGMLGVGKASLDTQNLTLSVTYDDTAIDEAIIRGLLAEAGYVAPTRDDATAMQISADGSVQRIAITDDGLQFDPDLILAAAGVPIEIDFSPGQECRVLVKFPQLAIEQDISQGGTVALPALEPGEYQILCSGDAVEGTLIVE